MVPFYGGRRDAVCRWLPMAVAGPPQEPGTEDVTGDEPGVQDMHSLGLMPLSWRSLGGRVARDQVGGRPDARIAGLDSTRRCCLADRVRHLAVKMVEDPGSGYISGQDDFLGIEREVFHNLTDALVQPMKAGARSGRVATGLASSALSVIAMNVVRPRIGGRAYLRNNHA